MTKYRYGTCPVIIDRALFPVFTTGMKIAFCTSAESASNLVDMLNGGGSTFQKGQEPVDLDSGDIALLTSWEFEYKNAHTKNEWKRRAAFSVEPKCRAEALSMIEAMGGVFDDETELRLVEVTRSIVHTTKTKKEDYISVELLGSGYAAVQYRWYEETAVGGMFDVWVTGVGRYRTYAEAYREALSWAASEKITLTAPRPEEANKPDLPFKNSILGAAMLNEPAASSRLDLDATFRGNAEGMALAGLHTIYSPYVTIERCSEGWAVSKMEWNPEAQKHLRVFENRECYMQREDAERNAKHVAAQLNWEYREPKK